MLHIIAGARITYRTNKGYPKRATQDKFYNKEIESWSKFDFRKTKLFKSIRKWISAVWPHYTSLLVNNFRRYVVCFSFSSHSRCEIERADGKTAGILRYPVRIPRAHLSLFSLITFGRAMISFGKNTEWCHHFDCGVPFVALLGYHCF